MRPGLMVVAAAAALILAGCGEPVINTDELETQIAAELQAQTGVTPESVTCPDDVPAQQGATFNCTVTADDGSTANITVTQQDDAGNVRWEVEGAG